MSTSIVFVFELIQFNYNVNAERNYLQKRQPTTKDVKLRNG